MRPNTGGDAAANHHPGARLLRKSSTGEASSLPSALPGHAGPTSFFLRNEEEMQQSMSASKTEGSHKENNYGVQSLEDALGAAFGDKASADAAGGSDKGSSPRSKGRVEEAKRWSKEVAEVQNELAEVMSGARPPGPARGTLPSLPLTPVQFELSPGPASDQPSTPKSVSLKSFRLSDEESQADEAASQAIMSSGEEEDDEDEGREPADSAVPQLVMPSIQMPKRRPFTEKGKNLGRLKVLIAGEAGVGKTSLIRSIVQLCEDIVHVDPLATKPPVIQSSEPLRSKSRRRKLRSGGTMSVTEVYASTRAYPSWWSDTEESRVLRRRKSTGDTVLERNLCFVDTPGFDASKSQPHSEPIVQYIEALLHRNASITAMNDGDLLGILSGNGGVQVDVVFFMLRPSDDAELSRNLEHMRRLSTLTNVIPLISHSDAHDKENISNFKAALLHRCEAAGIRPFLFGKSLEEALLAAQTRFETGFSETQSDPNPFFEPPKPVFTPGPFAITSASASDNDVMDASLLMSPDYIQPLVPSELASLVNQVFNQDTVAWLRHSAVKKFLRWRSERIQGESLTMHGVGLNTGITPTVFGQPTPTAAPFFHQSSASSSILSSPSPSQVLIPRPYTGSTAHTPFSPSQSHISPASPSSPSGSYNHNYTLARLADHTQREERLAQVRLAKWASDLQRSLDNERRRFEELERGKRARWLLEQVGQEVLDGRIVPALDHGDAGNGGGEWSLARHADIEQRIKREARWSGKGGRSRRMDPRDPLGLCEWGDEVRRGGWVVVQVLGGVGVLGAVVVAVWQLKAQGGGVLGGWWGGE